MSRDIAIELKNLKETVKINIKSLLYSSRNGLTEKELFKEYQQIFGSTIPYEKLGYQSIIDLMRDLNDISTIQRHHGTNLPIFFAIYDDQSLNLGSLVCRQLNRTKSLVENKRKMDAQRYNNNNNHYYNNNYNNHGNFYASNKNKHLNHFQQVFSVSSLMQHQIEKVLKNANHECILKLTEFERGFLNENGVLFNPRSCGFENSVQLLQSLKHLVEIDQDPKTNEFYVRLKLVDKGNYEKSNQKSKTNDFNNNKNSMSNNVNDKSKNQNSNNVSMKNKSTNQNDTCHARTSPNQVQPTKSMTLEEETVENLKKLIELNEPNGILLSSLPKKYHEFTKQALDFEQFGYSSILELIGHFANVDVNDDNEYILFMQKEPKQEMDKEKEDQSEHDSYHAFDEKYEQNMENLKNHMQITFANTNKPISLESFQKQFEKRNGWKFEPKDYGYETFDKLLSDLANNQLIDFNFDHRGTTYIFYLPVYQQQLHQIEENMIKNETFNSDKNNSNETDLSRDTSQNKSKEHHKEDLTLDAFIREHVVYNTNTDLDAKEIFKTIALKSTHNIIVSNVKNPCDIQIQLVDNQKELGDLMDDLEELYCGIGASFYNMPIEFVQHGHLCAAIYTGDQNWHRCRIIGFDTAKKLVRVAYIDYGGEEYVPLKNVKFLSRKFANLPIQAINAKFANIKASRENTWPKDTINYLLNRVMGKVFQANIIGFNNGRLSIELIEKVTLNNTSINLNKRIASDGYGTFYEESSEITFVKFDVWRESILNNKRSNRDKSLQSQKSSIATSRNDLTNCSNSINNKLAPNLSARLNLAKKTNSISSESSLFDSPSSKPNSNVNKQNRLSNDCTIKKKKLICQTLSNKETTLNLYSIDGVVLVHWTEIALLFGLNFQSFKGLISTLQNEEFFLIRFDFNSDNKILFTLCRDDNIDLDKLNEPDELIFVYYNRIKYLTEFFFDAYIANKIMGNLSNSDSKRRKQREPRKLIEGESELDELKRAITHNSTNKSSEEQNQSAIKESKSMDIDKKTIEERVDFLQKTLRLLKKKMSENNPKCDMYKLTESCKKYEEELEFYKLLLS